MKAAAAAQTEAEKVQRPRRYHRARTGKALDKLSPPVEYCQIVLLTVALHGNTDGDNVGQRGLRISSDGTFLHNLVEMTLPRGPYWAWTVTMPPPG